MLQTGFSKTVCSSNRYFDDERGSEEAMKQRLGQNICDIMPRSSIDSRPLPSPLVGPLADNRRLIEMLKNILNLPARDVQNLLRQEELSLGSRQRYEASRLGLKTGEWTPELVDFYHHTTMGVIGNPVWNRRAAKVRMREWIGKYLETATRHPLDILTVGDGSGFDSLYLAKCGHRVTYSETSASSRAFAEQMFADEHESIKVIDTLDNEPEQSFDVVVCLDVLEHIPSPPAFVGTLVGLMRPGGALIVHAPFFFVGPLNPTHLHSNRTYSGDIDRLYRRNGLRVASGRPWWDPIVLTKSGNCITHTSRLTAGILSITGRLLAVGRWWNWPHCQVATRLMQQHEPRWLAGLQDQF